MRRLNPGLNGDHFGLITFRSQASLAFNFSDSLNYKEHDLLGKLDEIGRITSYSPTDGRTRIGEALVMARDQLFSVAGGDRPDKPNVMIVLTDGLIKNAEMFKEIEKKIAKQFKVSKK